MSIRAYISNMAVNIYDDTGLTLNFLLCKKSWEDRSDVVSYESDIKKNTNFKPVTEKWLKLRGYPISKDYYASKSLLG